MGGGPRLGESPVMGGGPRLTELLRDAPRGSMNSSTTPPTTTRVHLRVPYQPAKWLILGVK